MDLVDIVLISVLHEPVALEIKQELLNKGVNADKIRWRNPRYINKIF